MKKRLLAAAVAAAVTLTAGVAMAAPVQFDGDIQLHYRWNTEDGAADTEGGKATFRLNAKAALDDKTTFYTRLAGQALSADEVGADFNKDLYGSSKFTMDRLGFIFKGDKATFNVGRQGATVGATALLYSTEGYLGSNMGSIDGVSGNVKAGATDISFIAGQETGLNNETVKLGDENKLYSLHASYNPATNWTIGGTLARYDVDGGDTTNHWAVNAAYNQGKAGYFAEYTKSNADDQNTAYAVGASYAFDTKNSFTAIYNKVEQNGDIGGWTDFDAYGKGMYYSYNHKITKDTTFNLFYKDMKTSDNTETGYDSFRTTVTYKF